MRILFMGNNRVGLEVLRWLKAEGEDFVGLVLPPPNVGSSATKYSEFPGFRKLISFWVRPSGIQRL